MIKELVRNKIEWDKPISNDNVKDFGECLALKALKTRASRSCGLFDNLYKSSIKDVFRPITTDRIFSDGYDVAQTSILFLLHYKGKKLDDVITDKFGNQVTIRYACYHEIDKYLTKYKNILVKEEQLDNSKKEVLPESHIETQEEIDEVEKKIQGMKLTVPELETLNHFLAGLTLIETTKLCNVCYTTIERRRWSMQRKYLAIQSI